ncbi:MAG: bacteriohemerythrin [Firmicutes bacterium]|nr:bacteriohemerythrin [Bacillota bacterium]
MEMKWSPDLATGFADIDNQHKELINRLNALFSAMTRGAGKAEIGKTIDFLGDYVIVHFSNEEKYMEQHKYPEASLHRTEHKKLIADFTKFKKEFEEKGASATLVVNTQKFLTDWLINHIKKVDTKLGAFLKKAK